MENEYIPLMSKDQFLGEQRMIESDEKIALLFRLEEPPSLTEVFQRINSVIPENQDVAVVCIPPNTSIEKAFQIMQQHKCSHLPVTIKNEVLGIFSYRSFSLHLMRMQFDEARLKTLPVEDFLEKPDYLQINNEIKKLVAVFEKEEVVLIGQAERLQAILTPVDAARFLHQISYPFILLGEIELVLRRLIEFCVNAEQLNDCIQRNLSSKYSKRNLPTTLEEMTYADYMAILNDPDTWNCFEAVFGDELQGYRTRLHIRLDQIRRIRNKVFHFKEPLNDEENQELLAHREWFLMKARSVEVLSERR
jgi:predicted transcriptional regulator